MSRLVVGIDPSLTCTGVAVVDVETRRVEVTARLRTKRDATDPWSVHHRISQQVGQVLRVVPLVVDVAVIESPESSNQWGAHNERVGLYRMLFHQLQFRGPVMPVTPRQRAKYASGAGNAKKPAVVAAMRERFPGLAIPDDNVADALALACVGARLIARPVDGDMGKAQREVFVKLAALWDERE